MTVQFESAIDFVGFMNYNMPYNDVYAKRLGQPLRRIEKYKLSWKKDGMLVSVKVVEFFVSCSFIILNYIGF